MLWPFSKAVNLKRPGSCHKHNKHESTVCNIGKKLALELSHSVQTTTLHLEPRHDRWTPLNLRRSIASLGELLHNSRLWSQWFVESVINKKNGFYKWPEPKLVIEGTTTNTSQVGSKHQPPIKENPVPNCFADQFISMQSQYIIK